MIRTDRFETIYGLVTDTLQEYARDAVSKGRMLPPDDAWFADLIRGFWNEYQRWPLYAGSNDIADYLGIFEARGIHRDLRLAGHVFLHIAYDLPRVIADKFSSHAGSRTRGRELFLRPAPRLLRVLLQYASGGAFGMVGRLAGRVEPIRFLGYWVIALRSVAWIHAEILADAAADRPRLETQMGIAIRNAAVEATSHRWVLGVPELDNNELLSVAGPAAASSVSIQTTLGIALASAATAAALTAFLLWRRNRPDRDNVAASIDVLGALILKNVTNALDPEIRVERLSMKGTRESQSRE